MQGKLASRKLWVTIVTFVVGVLYEVFGVEADPAVILGAVGAVIAYLGGQSWVDKTQVNADLAAWMATVQQAAAASAKAWSAEQLAETLGSSGYGSQETFGKVEDTQTESGA